MTISAIHYASFLELADAYRTGELTPLCVTRHMLSRIACVDPALHSFVTVTADIALEQAEKAGAEMVAGTFKGPMHGIPVAIKDLCETRGVKTTWGSRIFADYVPTVDCTVVKKLADAGSIMLGKLQLTEGAYAVHHPDVTPPNNPWNFDYWPGVSSSGSGVAVAAGLCFGAIGTDTGGSIRFPSGANGLTGIKPTWGRVSRHGVLPLASSMDHIGPMARSAADAGAMLGALAGVDVNDPTTLEAPVPDYLAKLGKSVKGLRIGLPSDFVFDVAEDDTAETIREAVRSLAEVGTTIEEVKMPDSTAAMYKQWSKVCAVEAAVAHSRFYPERKSEYGPVLAGLIEIGRNVDGMQLMEITHQRLIFQGQLRKLFERIDLLILPVHPYGNPTYAGFDSVLSRPNGVNDLLRYTAPFDMSGSPAITLPGGFTAVGLPIGFQLVGRHLDEALLVHVGNAYQRITDWHKRHPSL